MRWDPDASSYVGSPPDGRAAHGQKGALSSAGPARDVLRVVRIVGGPPQGIRTFEICQALRDVGFGQRNTPSFAYLADKLRGGLEKRKPHNPD